MLFFENLSGVKEDEYFRDGITEDIITELSKIKGLNIFSRPTVLVYRDKAVTPQQISQQLGAGYVLTGSLRRAGNRLRINTQLIDAHTDFPVWSERYDREMEDIFELQDEIARKIAEALRITLSPQEQAALAAKPTENLQAYDLYLRGKSYARRLTRHDLQFALQMFENALAQDWKFALARAALANVCAVYFVNYEREQSWIDRAVTAAQRASALQPELPEVQVAEAWMFYAEKRFEDAIQRVRRAIAAKPDCEGAYYLLGRALFAAGRYQEILEIAEIAVAASGEDYNVYVPILNALGALGKDEMRSNFRQRRILVLEEQIKKVPEDVRARVLLARLCEVRTCRGRHARSESRDGAAPERSDDSLQRRVRVLPVEQARRRDHRAREGLAGRMEGYRVDTPRPRSCAAPRDATVRTALSGEIRMIRTCLAEARKREGGSVRSIATALLLTLSAILFAQRAPVGNAVRQFVKVDTPVIVLTHARLIDGTGAAPRENQTIVLRDGKITAIGTADSVNSNPAENVTTIDLTGKTVLPGLVMLHEHLYYPTGPNVYGQLGQSFIRLYLAGGVTTMRTAGNTNGVMDLKLKEGVDAGTFAGPTIDATAPYLNGENTFLQMHALKDADVPVTLFGGPNM